MSALEHMKQVFKAHESDELLAERVAESNGEALKRARDLLAEVVAADTGTIEAPEPPLLRQRAKSSSE
jgi:hypothetical protein